jgi:hypothetical protein
MGTSVSPCHHVGQPHAERGQDAAEAVHEHGAHNEPSAHAMAHACCGPAPPNAASTWLAVSYPLL